jgi:hypothetical protein
MRYLRYTGGGQPSWTIIKSGTSAHAKDSELEVKVLPGAFGLTQLGRHLVIFELRDSAGNVATAG